MEVPLSLSEWLSPFGELRRLNSKIKLTFTSGGKMVLPQIYVQLVGAQWEQAVSSLAWGSENRSNTSGEKLEQSLFSVRGQGS